jgi:hypothetical protein
MAPVFPGNRLEDRTLRYERLHEVHFTIWPVVGGLLEESGVPYILR